MPILTFVRRAALTPATIALAATALAATVLAATALAGCGGSPPPANLISVSNGGCGSSWPVPKPGPYTFEIYNGAAEEGDVDLVNPANDAVYAEVEGLGPGTTAPMQVDIGSGRYAFVCTFEDYDPITGPAESVGGHVAGSPAILPVTGDDLIPISQQYHAYVTTGLVTLAGEVGKLLADVKAGNVAAAKADWLTAHLTYERLGAAYDSFQQYDPEIDGRPDGLAGGVNSPQWTGFYRLEYGLWHGQSTRELTGVATTLDNDVLALQKFWTTDEQDLLDMGLRTHEILENALEFQLSGHDDYGSGTTLATTVANIAGTQELLTLLHPLLADRYALLPEVYTWLATLQGLVDKYGYQNGQWIPVTSLSLTAREQIDSACDQALEELAPIAAITEPRSI
jgi:iron uptake system component EfeO